MNLEQEIAEYEKRVYGEGQMPAANKAALRQMIKNDDFSAANEEREDSHSPVGDEYNMEVNQTNEE